MKLVFFIDCARVLGGGDIAQFMFAAHLSKRGHEVLVFTRDKNIFLKQLEREYKDLKIHAFRTIPMFMRGVGIGRLNNVLDGLYTYFRVQKIVHEFKPDWVIGYLRYSASKAVLVGKNLGIKVANFIFESPPWMKEQLKEKWDELLENQGFKDSWERTKKAYLASDVLIPNSKLAGKKCKEWLDEVHVSEPVYPGVDLSLARAGNKGKKTYDIISACRLHPLKNLDELLYACAKVSKKLSIVFVGDGEDKARLEGIAKKLGLHVTFAGFVSEEDKWKYFNKSRLLVFPTSFEGFGMSPLEGLATDCNAVCSDIPILREVYGDHVYYHKLHDADDLAKAIGKALKMKKLKKNPAPLFKKYSWESAARTIEKILKVKS